MTNLEGFVFAAYLSTRRLWLLSILASELVRTIRSEMMFNVEDLVISIQTDLPEVKAPYGGHVQPVQSLLL
jgi:hypothetical protein